MDLPPDKEHTIATKKTEGKNFLTKIIIISTYMFGDQIQKVKKLNSCRFRDCKYEKNNLPPNRT